MKGKQVNRNTTTNTTIKNGKQVKKNTTANTRRIIVNDVDVYIHREGTILRLQEHSSDFLTYHIKGKAKKMSELV